MKSAMDFYNSNNSMQFDEALLDNNLTEEVSSLNNTRRSSRLLRKESPISSWKDNWEEIHVQVYDKLEGWLYGTAWRSLHNGSECWPLEQVYHAYMYGWTVSHCRDTMWPGFFKQRGLVVVQGDGHFSGEGRWEMRCPQEMVQVISTAPVPMFHNQQELADNRFAKGKRWEGRLRLF